jgi:hypothetical protein
MQAKSVEVTGVDEGSAREKGTDAPARETASSGQAAAFQAEDLGNSRSDQFCPSHCAHHYVELHCYYWYSKRPYPWIERSSSEAGKNLCIE